MSYVPLQQSSIILLIGKFQHIVLESTLLLDCVFSTIKLSHRLRLISSLCVKFNGCTTAKLPIYLFGYQTYCCRLFNVRLFLPSLQIKIYSISTNISFLIRTVQLKAYNLSSCNRMIGSRV